ncbi:DUF1461 domain-containing protein [Candidatus Woesearchaeota archaeon]|nr:DUF1461 domain-containing protein [Candidatus Woesearchaeota archaeon]
MRFLTSLNLLLIIVAPFMIFLGAFKYTSFNENFYDEKFEQYGVYRNVPNASWMHQKIISFITGKNNELPEQLNEMERLHLTDVRSAIRNSTILFYLLIILFILSSLASFLILKDKRRIINFAGKVLVFGGLLAIAMSLALFLLINLDFPSAFEAFHMALFKQGTYTFDPSKELLVNIYPEQLFMDLGLRIAKAVIFISAAATAIGVLLLKSKRVKNKNRITMNK